ncbi:MAG TPA: thioredoxin domain-containing protein [Patescibacteria group bacterium]|nr:thioredoxin domain-containing protein [Patescibacteria group bacterium]
MKNLPILIGSLLVTIAVVVGVAFVFTKKANAPAAPAPEALVQGDHRNSKGTPGSKIALTEFSDFECPSCRAAQPLVEQILQQGGSNIYFVYREFPLESIHKNALAGAKAAESAGKQGKFWQMHDKLFASQDEWATLANPNDKLVSYAKDLGLNTDQFSKDFSSKEVADLVTKDQGDGLALGVNATPTFYVNNVSTDVSSLASTIQQLLGGK